MVVSVEVFMASFSGVCIPFVDIKTYFLAPFAIKWDLNSKVRRDPWFIQNEAPYRS